MPLSSGNELAKVRMPGIAVPPSDAELKRPIAAEAAPLLLFQNAAGLLTRTLNWVRERQSARSSSRRLQVAATVSLGDKRFVAVIHVDGLQFLVGGGATNVALLAQLNGKDSFKDLLQEKMTVHLSKRDEPILERAREQA